MEKNIFKFCSQIGVRNYEVDWQGIVHNANYLLYFEVGRIEYLKNLKIQIDLKSIQTNSKIVLVRNEINHLMPAKFDETLNIYTRISEIRNSSFVFEGILEEKNSKRIIAENVAYHVWLNPKNNKSKRVSNSFRKIVKEFEKENLKI